MALDEPKETDQTCELGGKTYMIDKELAEKVGQVNVDFVTQGWRSGFVISSENPIAFGSGSSECGSCSC